MDQGFHQCLCDIVARIIILSGEILFADMIKDIIDACNHLSLRERKSKLWIQDRKLWHYLVPENMSDLQFLLMIGYYGTCVHFRAGSGHGKDTSDRKDVACGFLKPDIVFIPWIFITVHRYGNSLGIITAGSSAYGKKQICLIVPRNFNSITKFLYSGIRHYARILYYVFPIVLQDLYDLIIYTVFLDGATSIDQLNIFPILGKFIIQILKGVIPKI